MNKKQNKTKTCNFQGHICLFLLQEKEVQLLHQWPTADFQSGGTSEGSVLPGSWAQRSHSARHGGRRAASPCALTEPQVTSQCAG